MPDWNVLGSLMNQLHDDFVNVYYMMLPVFFALAVVVTWFKNPQGSLDFLDILKRALISTILLIALPEITQAITAITNGLAERIDSINGLDNFLKMAQEKSQEYSFSPTSLVLQFDDLIIATLAFLSYIFVYIARFLTIAMYHFYWIFYTVLAPLLLLFNLFPATSQITVNLFRAMIEVASWKIIWALLGAMLTALSFSHIYQIEGNYIVIVAMNFIIATAMLMTPKIVNSLVGSGFHSEARSIGLMATAAALVSPAKIMMLKNVGQTVLGQNPMRPNNTNKQKVQK